MSETGQVKYLTSSLLASFFFNIFSILLIIIPLYGLLNLPNIIGPSSSQLFFRQCFRLLLLVGHVLILSLMVLASYFFHDKSDQLLSSRQPPNWRILWSF